MSEEKKPKITVIGGGTGLPILLEGLKDQAEKITAVVAVSDDGGSSGVIRSAINTIPPGDIRNCIVALSDAELAYKQVFQYRFEDGDHEFSGHAIGNLIIAALNEMRGNIYDAIDLASKLMEVKGRVLPASQSPLVLQGHMVNGEVIEGETTIVASKQAIDYVTVAKADQNGHPRGEAHAGYGVVQSILEADVVVLGPGSLFTSILPNLAIPEIKQALNDTPATVVYVCNIMTQKGETIHFSDADHLKKIIKHIGEDAVDVMVINGTHVPEDYEPQESRIDYLEQVVHDQAGLDQYEVEVTSQDLLDLKKTGVYHNKEKLAGAIMDIYRRRQ